MIALQGLLCEIILMNILKVTPPIINYKKLFIFKILYFYKAQSEYNVLILQSIFYQVPDLSQR